MLRAPEGICLLAIGLAAAAQAAGPPPERYHPPTLAWAEISPDNALIVTEFFQTPARKGKPRRYFTLTFDAKTGKRLGALPGADFRSGRPLVAMAPDGKHLLLVLPAQDPRNPALQRLVLWDAKAS